MYTRRRVHLIVRDRDRADAVYAGDGVVLRSLGHPKSGNGNIVHQGGPAVGGVVEARGTALLVHLFVVVVALRLAVDLIRRQVLALDKAVLLGPPRAEMYPELLSPSAAVSLSYGASAGSTRV